MAKQQTDDELNLRRKARRRLIGAVAFTLAVVVVLPMVLDSEPKPNGNDIDLRIPSPDKVGEFVPGAAVSEVAGTTPQAAPVVVTPVPLATSEVVPPVQHAAPAAPAHKPSEIPKPAEAGGADKTASGEGYVAQVGAYSNPDAAKQELNKLRKWGFKAYTEKSGDKIRVRVGPYPDRDKAEKVGQLLEKHGLHPVILSAK
ncbi:MAG: SPOR domain-containing protein [Gallionella sp.]